MKINRIVTILLVLCMLALVGCNNAYKKALNKDNNISFAEKQLYAVAYLGYEKIEDLAFYEEKYLNDEIVPIHYFSEGEYYLIIPRYDTMKVCLYRNDLETMNTKLVYENESCKPFIIQCNISDIFSDVTISLEYQGEIVEFSPYISLMDGSVVVGERGINITK